MKMKLERSSVSKLAGGIALAIAALTGGQAWAQSAVLVEAGNERLRDDLQWLADRGVISLSTSAWPLPLAAIESALAGRRATVGATDVSVLAAVEAELAHYRARTGAGVALRANTNSLPSFGFEEPVRGEGDASAWLQMNRENLAGRLELHKLFSPLTDRQSHGNLEGSYLAGQWGGQVLYAGQLPHWWGPGQDGSLIWSNTGLAIPGFGLKRGQERPFETRWLAWLGPWSYEAFLGRMQHNRVVPGARVFALRLQARPLPQLEVAASRLIQWGGAGGGNGFGDLVDAIRGRSNDIDTFNNEIAGFDARYTWLPGGNPLTLYGQFIGEDEAGLRPTDYLSLAGLQFKHTWAATRLQWHVETADTMSARLFGLKKGVPNIAYRHSQFRDGMYHEGLPIGHFIGGDGRAHAIGVSVTPLRSANALRYALRFIRADVNPSSQVENLAFPTSDRIRIAEFSADWQMRAFGLSPIKMHLGLRTMNTRTGGRDNGAKIGIELPLSGF
ncbi:capsule assembly Wzi family protein [Ramlibacter alkalitolerans]|uniref:Capsule assembly Wzi family protein n=1 Tax=Ramlibacter alkalitolerans TaxID=2039631 RepID=A0ABS1JLE4_9BURK|nr:capsule assembly Wzi family protein [Ramlibacter alkalitolerans]MBL0425044.1 hypothetical protein [Ramlibacter alkalitolerans]